MVIFSCVVYRCIVLIPLWKFQLKIPEESKNLHFQKSMIDKLIKSLYYDRLCKVQEKPLTEYHFYQDSHNATSNIKHINIFGGCNGDRENKKSNFLYIFSFHTQTQNIRSMLEQQIKYLLSKSRTTIPLPQNALLTSTEYKEREIRLQQLPKLVETFSFYSSSDRIFSQFQYAFSYNLSASYHQFIKCINLINGFGCF